MNCETCSDSSVRIKIGDTFSAIATYSDANGNPINLTTEDITITSVLTDMDGNVADVLTVTILDQTVTANIGKYSITGDSTNWASGSYFWTIKYNQSGIISTTDRISVLVVVE